MHAVQGRDTYGRPPPRGSAGAGDEVISRRSLLRLRLTGHARRDIDHDSVTERVRGCWDRDEHEPLLRQLEPAAELLCDLAPRMVERGKARCPAAFWRVADVQELPYDDGEFDAVLSSFGAHLAPKPSQAAGELVRVTRPGGFVALAAWVPRGLPGRMDELVERFAPLPEGVPQPDRWGVEEVARRRLGPLVEDLQVRTRTLPLRFDSPEAAFETLLLAHPLDAQDREALRPR